MMQGSLGRFSMPEISNVILQIFSNALFIKCIHFELCFCNVGKFDQIDMIRMYRENIINELKKTI